MNQTRLYISLAPGGEGDVQKENLRWLASRLGFKEYGGNISAMLQHMARAVETSPVDFAEAVEDALAVAAGIGE